MRFQSKWLLVSFLWAIPWLASASKLTAEVIKAMSNGAMSKFVLQVNDDMGHPVSNASVCVFFDMLPTPHSAYGKTDANGSCVVEGKTNGNKIKFRVGKDGYYGSHKEITYVEIGGARGGARVRAD